MRKFSVVFFIVAMTMVVEASFNREGQMDFANSADSAAVKLANATLLAHGGKKLKGMKTMSMRGGVELSRSGSTQAIPGSFVLVFAGVKNKVDIQSPFFNFKQVSDGTDHFYSIVGFGFPIYDSGIFAIAKIGEDGYRVSSLSGKLEKKNGFRITNPNGLFTDFIVNKKTNRVKEYESKYVLHEQDLTTSVVVDEYQEVEGALVYKVFNQRLERGTDTFYAKFKAKEILVNSKIEESVFKISGK